MRSNAKPAIRLSRLYLPPPVRQQLVQTRNTGTQIVDRVGGLPCCKQRFTGCQINVAGDSFECRKVGLIERTAYAERSHRADRAGVGAVTRQI